MGNKVLGGTTLIRGSIILKVDKIAENAAIS